MGKLIGILGKKHSGKDTCADYITQFNFVKESFATPLKKSLMILFNFSYEQLWGDKKEEIDNRWGISPRNAMQFFGTNIVRDQFSDLIPNIGENFWVKSFETWYENNKNNNVVIADCRFQNEVDTIKKLGGIIIKLERQNIVSDSHISETQIDFITGYDYIIQNNGSIDDLHKKIDLILNK